MTSLDMAGMSLSVLKVDDPILSSLDFATKAPAWPVGVGGPRPSTTLPVSLPPAPPNLNPDPVRPQELSQQGQKLEAAIRAGAQAVLNFKDALNEWDRMVGDGDCGTTMATGAKTVIEDLDKQYDIFTRAAFVILKDGGSPVTAKKWSAAFDAGVAAVGKYGGASAGHPFKALHDAADAADAGAVATKTMLAQAGRSSYVPDHVLASVPDPGAMAAAQWLTAVAEALSPSSSPR